MNNCNECLHEKVCSNKSIAFYRCNEFINKHAILVFDPPLNTKVYIKQKRCQDCEFFAPELRNLGFECQFGYSSDESVCMQPCRHHIHIVEIKSMAHMYNKHVENILTLSNKYKLRKEDFNDENYCHY